MKARTLVVIGSTVVPVLSAGMAYTASAEEAPPSITDLGADLRTAVNAQEFGTGIVDNDTDAPIAHMPNVDVAVIGLDGDGRPVSAGNVLVNEAYPSGEVVPLDANMNTTDVRWRRWDTGQWDAGAPGTEDIVPGREDAPLETMASYPASVLKLMVGFGVLRLVDDGVIALDEDYAYSPETPNSSCGDAGTNTVREWFDAMITVSDNRSTCSMIKLLHDHGYVDTLNQTFEDVGLPTLELRGTDPTNGGSWIDTTMTAMETAKLLLIVEGAPGVLWRAPDGSDVSADMLSADSRSFFSAVLGEQGLNQVLSTTNWCGRDYPPPGIPQRVDDRWIDPDDGTVTVDGRVYGQDVRPCNEAAEVTFAHKTGLTTNAGGDAGIVHSLPDKAVRNYIVVAFTNLGSRFADADKPDDPPGIYPVAYSAKFATLGKAIDDMMRPAS